MLTIPTLEWGALAPQLIMLATLLVVMLMDLGLEQKDKDRLAYISLVGVLLALVASIYWTPRVGSAFVGTMTSDTFSVFFGSIVLVATALVLLASPGYLNRVGSEHHGEFYTLILGATLGMLIMTGAISFMTIFLGLEILSLSLYILSGFLTRRNVSQEAGMKYFILSSFILAFMLYGITLIYGATGSTSLPGINTFVSSRTLGQLSSDPLLVTGMVLLGIGLIFKISAIPFHWWTPDVYQGAPTPITALMSVGTKAAVFAVLMRVFLFTLGPLQPLWIYLIWVVAVLTLIFGNLLAAPQTNVKRLLAYSSVAQAGYILIGMIANNTLGIAAMLFYLLVYAFMNIGAFAVVIALERADGSNSDMRDFNGLSQRQPLLAAIMAICLISLAGLPPTAGFFGKLYLFSAAVQSGNLLLALIGVATSLIAIYYYLRVVVAMYMRPASEAQLSTAPVTLSAPLTLALVVTGIGTLLLSVFAGSSLGLAERSVAMLERLVG